MVPCSILIDVLNLHLLGGNHFDSTKGFKNGAGVGPSSSEVIYFSGTRILIEFRKKTRHVEGMKSVSHLLSFVAVDLIQLLFKIHSD